MSAVAAWRSPLPAWADDAACLYAEPETFFPDKGQSVEPAKKVCKDCPVQPQCLAYALDTRQPEGVWGGMSPNERDDLRQALSREALQSTQETTDA